MTAAAIIIFFTKFAIRMIKSEIHIIIVLTNDMYHKYFGYFVVFVLRPIPDDSFTTQTGRSKEWNREYFPKIKFARLLMQ